MADADELKKVRVVARRNVAGAIRKLTSLVGFGADESELKAGAETLDNLFDNLNEVHLEYLDTSGSEEDSYLREITKSFDEIMQSYRNSLEANVQIKRENDAIPLRKNVERGFVRIKTLIERMEGCLSSVDGTQRVDREGLKEDKENIEGLLGTLLSDITKLGSVADITNEDREADVIISRADEVKRKVNIFLRKSQGTIRSESSYLVTNTQISSQTNESEIEKGAENGQTGTVGSNHPTQVSDTLTQVSGVSTQVSGTSSKSNSLTQCSIKSQSGTPIHHAGMSPQRGSSAEVNAVSMQARPLMSNTIGETQFLPGAQGLAFPAPYLGYPSASYPYPTPTPASYPYPTSAHAFSPHAVPYFPGVSQGGANFFQAPTGTSSMAYDPNVTSVVHTKKPSLPTFSGERADWPEFKRVWKTLAEGQFVNRMQLAMELKRSCSKGKAAERIKHIYVTTDNAYEEIWKRLYEEYDDPGLSVQAAINRLMSLKSVDDYDYGGIVKLVDVVEGVHNQLRELNQLTAIHMVDVDRISMLLPRAMHVDWMRMYRDLGDTDKIRPFPRFVDFLRKERASIARLAESTLQVNRKTRKDDGKPNKQLHAIGSHGAKGGSRPAQSSGNQASESKIKNCIIHGSVGHTSVECRNFKKLTVKQRYDEVRKKKRCFKCFGEHPRAECKVRACKCGKDHHYLLCTQRDMALEPDKQSSQTHSVESESSELTVTTQSLLVKAGTMALYPIHLAHVAGHTRSITVFMDGGSNASYITERCAAKLKLRRVERVTLDVTTVGGEEKEYKSSIYEIPLRSVSGRTTKLLVYSLEDITGPLSPIDGEVIRVLFPNHDPDALVRPSNSVDLLIGTDYYGLHPKLEVARAGEHLSIMQGELGICLVGTHPQLKENTTLSKSFPRKLNGSFSQVGTHLSVMRRAHPAFSMPDSFFTGEELGIDSSPKCGSCKCGSCPLPGHSLSFREEQELHMIRTNLEYDRDNKVWTTSYPWIIDPHSLPNNYSSALATLRSTEKALERDPGWAKSYGEQIKDMLDRDVARKLTLEEMKQWNGPEYYISHLAVINAKSKSTPVRIVFNSSQVCKGVSLNGCLAKGPDSYRNTGLGILLRWKEENVVLVGDIRKMFHAVHLKPLEQHCHRFLWREDSTGDPDVYVMLRVNMGDKPAPAIATEALQMTAEMYEESFPKASEFIKGSSYVDDLVDSVPSLAEAKELAKETEDLLAQGGFHVKCWQMSGDKSPLESSQRELKDDGTHVGVLGTRWNSEEDSFSYEVGINFSKRKHGAKTGPDLRREEIPECIPPILTKRLVLQQVMSIYDPMGIVSPFTLLGKIYLRDAWLLKLDWDDPLPLAMHLKWLEFFKSLFDLGELSFPRCLKPKNAEGDPWLIILSDGSDVAYGCAAYVRWKCKDDSIKMRLIMAKSRIAPINRISTPRMELNGAVLSKRCRVVIAKEMRYRFERVLHLVDSETVLNMINKTSYRFKIYEGVRIGEIQAATNGDMSEWAWVPGEANTADWLTRGCQPSEISEDSDWFQGPPMLRLPFDSWTIKFGKVSEETLPGEKKVTSVHATEIYSKDNDLFDCRRVNYLHKAVKIVARLISVAEQKSLKGGQERFITPDMMIRAEEHMIKEAQSAVDIGGPTHKRLNPAMNKNGIWIVGSSRLANHNPMNVIHASLPIFLPRNHPFTRLAMEEAHRRGHRGRDATLATFRGKYWTPSGPKLARTVRDNCQLCKLRDVNTVQQEMGRLPAERLKPSPPFTFTMLDLFGPYSVRGEIQKRIRGKAWVVIFTDLCSRAVHMEAIFGYDSSNFLLALSRFASLRGWPKKIYSDPGTQLVGSHKEICESARRLGIQHGMQWVIGPADSPWHQGAVESLVKSAKRALSLAIHNQVLSAPELITVCSEAANTINERPIGLLPSLDSEINVLTPNCLLLGRATAANPGGWQPGNSSLKTRYHMVCAVGDQFWKHWLELFAPTLVHRPKWFSASRNLQVGDVVLVADKNTLRGEYRLAIVTDIHPGSDGKVRCATVSYKNFKVNEQVRMYKGSEYTSVKRSVQRLVLLVPVKEPELQPGRSS